MDVGEFTVKDAAGNPPKLTAVVPVKFKPVIDTFVPVTPLVGVKDVITGPVYVKPARLPVPLAVVTVTLPELPFETTALIVVSDNIVYEVANIPPNLTAVAPVKFTPLIFTVVP
jgi:hypothetical protein